ncbi:MAG TPA: CPBP family intramembrane glutamic endopeptidase [Bacteroidia bacterium]|jgi:membrane protease YdiL (CAAX protease family)|nr:CPBP family intramembrane glutamic endopeptidase [Bacteroidia bacterium]
MNSFISKDRFGLFIVLGYLLLCFVLFIAENNQPVQVPTDAKEISMLKIAQVITSTLLFIVPVTLFCRYLRPERSAFLNMNTMPHLYFLITAAACIFFALPAVAGFEQWNLGIHLPSAFSSTESWMHQKENDAEKVYLAFFEDKSTLGLIINLLVMGLVAALSEELFFRGLLQQIFIKNKINAHIAIVLTAVLFSAFHLQFFGFLPRLFLGIVLGYLYYITQNLWVSIAAHFFNNAFAIISVHMFTEEAAPAAANSPAGQEQSIGIAFILLSLVMVAAQLIFLQRFVNRTKLPTTHKE